MKRIRTKGDVEVQNIKIGDVQYEYGYGLGIKSTVVTLPVETEPGFWEWKNKTDNGVTINYGVNEKYAHYSANLYTYRAYS